MSQLDRTIDCFTPLAAYIVHFGIVKARLQKEGFLVSESIRFFFFPNYLKDTSKVIELSGKTAAVFQILYLKCAVSSGMPLSSWRSVPVAEQIKIVLIYVECYAFLSSCYIVNILLFSCWYGSQWGSFFLHCLENWHYCKCSLSIDRRICSPHLVRRIIWFPLIEYLWIMPQRHSSHRATGIYESFFFNLLIIFLFQLYVLF